MVTWTMGANRSAAEAANRRDLPAVFGKLHAIHGTPASAAVITGVVSTAVIIGYGLIAASAEDLFWTLYSFSSIVFLLPYLLMFAAFASLRRADAQRPRPYRVPGGRLAAWTLATLCSAFIIQAVVLFVWAPGQELFTTKTAAIVVGVVLTLIVGEWLIARAQHVPSGTSGVAGHSGAA
jgi:amino acid transporter